MFKTRGYTLIELAIVLVVVGFVIAGGANAWRLYQIQQRAETTVLNVDRAVIAIDTFVSRNGRYPCPASLTVDPENPNYGMEGNCNNGGGLTYNDVAAQDPTNPAFAGYFLEKSQRNIKDTPPVAAPPGDNDNIRRGAIPFRILGIKESDVIDGQGNRLQYAVTERLTIAAADGGYDPTLGGITVVAANSGADITQSAHFLVLSSGPDGRGAFTRQGKLGIPCDAVTNPTDTADDGNNCSAAANHLSIYTQSSRKSGTAGNFDDEIKYYSSVERPLWSANDQRGTNIRDEFTIPADPTHPDERKAAVGTTSAYIEPAAPNAADPEEVRLRVLGDVQATSNGDGSGTRGAVKVSPAQGLCSEAVSGDQNCLNPQKIATVGTPENDMLNCPHLVAGPWGGPSPAGFDYVQEVRDGYAVCTNQVVQSCPGAVYGVAANGSLLCAPTPPPAGVRCPETPVRMYCEEGVNEQARVLLEGNPGDTQTLTMTDMTPGGNPFDYTMRDHYYCSHDGTWEYICDTRSAGWELNGYSSAGFQRERPNGELMTHADGTPFEWEEAFECFERCTPEQAATGECSNTWEDDRTGAGEYVSDVRYGDRFRGACGCTVQAQVAEPRGCWSSFQDMREEFGSIRDIFQPRGDSWWMRWYDDFDVNSVDDATRTRWATICSETELVEYCLDVDACVCETDTETYTLDCNPGQTGTGATYRRDRFCGDPPAGVTLPGYQYGFSSIPTYACPQQQAQIGTVVWTLLAPGNCTCAAQPDDVDPLTCPTGFTGARTSTRTWNITDCEYNDPVITGTCACNPAATTNNHQNCPFGSSGSGIDQLCTMNCTTGQMECVTTNTCTPDPGCAVTAESSTEACPNPPYVDGDIVRNWQEDCHEQMVAGSLTENYAGCVWDPDTRWKDQSQVLNTVGTQPPGMPQRGTACTPPDFGSCYAPAPGGNYYIYWCSCQP